MRIALVGPYPADSTRVRGGVESSFSGLVSGFARFEATELHVVTFVPGLERRTSTLTEGVRLTRLPGTRRGANVSRHVRERRLLAAFLEELRPDLVHAQDALRYGYVCLKARPPAPVVVSIHGIVREERRFAAGVRARLQIGLAGVALERYCVRHAPFLVSPTQYAEEYFGAEMRGRFWDVPNPVPDSYFEAPSTPERGRILYSGSLVARKRLLDVVEALPVIGSSVPDARLRVAGDDDGDYGRRVRERVHELGLDGRVTFLGSLAPDAMREEYARAAVLVLPSGQETSPMVIGEAMAVGVPVVATQVGGVRHLVEEGVTGHLVEVGDMAALAERIATVLSDPEAGSRLGAAGRARAERSFRTVAVAERMREVYEAVLAKASGP